MSRTQFGVCRVRPTLAQARAILAVARKHGVTFVEYQEPQRRDSYRSWFDGPNRGDPFDDSLAREVYEDLVREGLDCEHRGAK